MMIDVDKLSLREVLHLRREIQIVLAQKPQQRGERIIRVESELDSAIDTRRATRHTDA
jgi:hypothetical protein